MVCTAAVGEVFVSMPLVEYHLLCIAVHLQLEFALVIEGQMLFSELKSKSFCMGVSYGTKVGASQRHAKRVIYSAS